MAGGGVDWGTAAVVISVWLVASGGTGVPGLWWLAYGWWRLGASLGRHDFKSGAHIQCPLYPAYAEACIARAMQGVSFAIVNFYCNPPFLNLSGPAKVIYTLAWAGPRVVRTDVSHIFAPLICIGSSALQVRASPDLVAFNCQHSPAQAECLHVVILTCTTQ